MARRAKRRTRSLFTATILAIGLGLLISFGVLKSQESRSQAATSTTTVVFAIDLHGIGRAGDAANPLYDANVEPVNNERSLILYLINESTQQMSGGNAFAVYDSNSGSFEGELEIHDIPSGQYTVKATVPTYLEGVIDQPVDVVAGERVVIPALTLIAGDVNEDNKLDVSDYTIIFDCLEFMESATACSADKKSAADIDNDGKVTQYDYNLFLREVTAASQQSQEATFLIDGELDFTQMTPDVTADPTTTAAP